ncbi:galactan beta-1,4-galactosyltransferase gals2 [Plakobranchus ocellatus]|uniref:Glycosyltransferase family 92 protein n=1 Tax=Plakobranchus ocellatus TaxID=259542 RepID=A0AAV4A9E0_9GAST|nr:galactan beta-1,4-galactosyltransferase gals2 [Plakobranchus ocellatus]
MLKIFFMKSPEPRYRNNLILASEKYSPLTEELSTPSTQTEEHPGNQRKFAAAEQTKMKEKAPENKVLDNNAKNSVKSGNQAVLPAAERRKPETIPAPSKISDETPKQIIKPGNQRKPVLADQTKIKKEPPSDNVLKDKAQDTVKSGNPTKSPLADKKNLKEMSSSSKIPDNSVKDTLKTDNRTAEQMIEEIRSLWDKENYEDVVRLPNISLSERPPDFQEVKDLGSILYVHSALWQDDHVRITVIKLLKVPMDNALCVLWYSTDPGARPYFVKAVVKDLFSYYFKNACGYIKCLVKEGEGRSDKIPVFVSLVDGRNITSGIKVTLPIENRDKHENPDELFTAGQGGATGSIAGKDRVVEFTVCIPTMFKFNDAAILVEKLEMVKLLGAGRVVLYNFYVRANVQAVLNMYTREYAAGREKLEVVVHSWKLPPIIIHYRGQIASIDDCLHRYKWRSRYIVFDDLDELVIPLQHANWSGLIAERERVHPNYAAFMIRSTIMNRDISSPAKGFETEAFRLGSNVLRVTKRDDFIWPPRMRSKLIVNPRKIEALQVHIVEEAYGRTDVVPPEQAMLYHYRMPVRNSCEDVRDTRVADKYGKRLALALKAAWSKLEGVSLGPKPSNKTIRKRCLPQAIAVQTKLSNETKSKS